MLGKVFTYHGQYATDNNSANPRTFRPLQIKRLDELNRTREDCSNLVVL